MARVAAHDPCHRSPHRLWGEEIRRTPAATTHAPRHHTASHAAAACTPPTGATPQRRQTPRMPNASGGQAALRRPRLCGRGRGPRRQPPPGALPRWLRPVAAGRRERRGARDGRCQRHPRTPAGETARGREREDKPKKPLCYYVPCPWILLLYGCCRITKVRFGT
uniref:Uncharacterized protein n=1 Tax=Aegilops tauschii subsp. strangulata TaxID=200361 RepID=A0A453GJ73_AEGTS